MHDQSTSRRRRLALGCAAAAVLIALSGCTPGSGSGGTDVAGTDASSTDPGVEQSAAPTPTPTADAVPSIVITPETVQLADAAGSLLGEYAYDGTASLAIDAFTTLLGEPTEKPYKGGSEGGPGVEYVWDGILISDSERPAEPGAANGNDFTVIASAPTVDGVDGEIAVTTPGGFEVGETLTQVLSTPGTISGGLPGEVAVQFGASRGASETQLFPNAYAVVVYGDTSGSVKTIIAPSNLGVARV
ncbi:hypothetical protein [Herbiconiux liangxiaofengii]|uniref:hypothetical protein n=1 Tax=Herbiconiux liangxiaofengii TaxID=3342795 RepID=UPI0035B81F53